MKSTVSNRHTVRLGKVVTLAAVTCVGSSPSQFLAICNTLPGESKLAPLLGHGEKFGGNWPLGGTETSAVAGARGNKLFVLEPLARTLW